MDLYAFKIYMLDVGLLLAMTDLDASVIIDGNRIFTEFKGALTEQYVLQQMIAELGVEPYYYTTPIIVFSSDNKKISLFNNAFFIF